MSRLTQIVIGIAGALVLLITVSVGVITWQHHQPRHTLTDCTVSSVDQGRRTVKVESTCGQLKAPNGSRFDERINFFGIEEGGTFDFVVRGYDWEVPTIVEWERSDPDWLIGR